MAIAENKQVVNVMPTHAAIDLTSTILIRPKVVVHLPNGDVDTTKSGMGLPVEISLAQLKTLLA